MRKLLIGLILVVVIALAGATYILPTYISNQISGRIERSLQTDSVSANIETSPSFMMLFGQVDNIDIEATNIKLDKVNLNELSLKGENIEISVQDLLLARRLVINSADNLIITGLIDENNLAQLLAKEVDKISDIAVKITPDNVEATGKISFLGQEATINVKGIIVVEGKNLLFRITDANTENRLFGKIGISFTKDIFLVSTDKLPLEGAKFTRVEQQNGQVLIEAGINK
ncbi:LmeA family phospholipid-binding protein [Megamonas funiformis]|uniref:LmeA family phospholipid-binding protein n=1 Tax=Megamonas funiformis TaxID=437897 RepID=UPI002671F49A|nr:LmeA family phospholipid-binding protein [Megamonas funiformis]